MKNLDLSMKKLFSSFLSDNNNECDETKENLLKSYDNLNTRDTDQYCITIDDVDDHPCSGSRRQRSHSFIAPSIMDRTELKINEDPFASSPSSIRKKLSFNLNLKPVCQEVANQIEVVTERNKIKTPSISRKKAKSLILQLTDRLNTKDEENDSNSDSISFFLSHRTVNFDACYEYLSYHLPLMNSASSDCFRLNISTCRKNSNNNNSFTRSFSGNKMSFVDAQAQNLVTNYDEYVKLLEDKLEEYEADILALGEKLDFKENEINGLCENYEEEIVRKMENMHGQLSTDVKYWEDKYNKEQSINSELQDENHQLYIQINDLQSQNDLLNEQKSEINIKFKELQKECKSNENLILNFKNRIKELENEDLSLNTTAAFTDSNRFSVTSSIYDNTPRKSTISILKESLCNKYNVNLNNESSEKTENTSMSENIKRKSFAKNKVDHSTVKMKDMEVNTTLSSTEVYEIDELYRLRAFHINSTNQLDKAEAEINLKNILNNNLIKENEKLKSEIQKNLNSESVNREDFIELKQKNVELKRKVNQQQTTIDELEFKFLDAYEHHAESNNITEGSSAMKSKLDAALTENYNLAQSYEHLLKEKDLNLEKVNAHLSEISQKYEYVSNDLNLVRAQLDIVMADKMELENELEVTKQRHSKYKSELATRRSLLDKFVIENEDLKSENYDLRTSVETSERKLKILDDDLRSIKSTRSTNSHFEKVSNSLFFY